MSRKKVSIRKKNLGIGPRIRIFRKSKDLNLEQFADIIGISHSTLSEIENENTTPSSETLIKIVQHTDITPIELMEILTGEQKKIIYKMDDKVVEFPGEEGLIYLTKKTIELLDMAVEILNSDYSDALAANIRAFHTAIKDKVKHKKDVDDLKKRMNSFEKKGTGNAEVGSGSQSHTGDATRKKER